jgi:hypothetical protein
MEEALLIKAQRYAEVRQLHLGSRLGFGIHGAVLVAESNLKPNRSAVKIHRELETYSRERSVYERLQNHGVSVIEGFNVPQFLSADDEMLVIEMTIVERPFLLDFAGAYLDNAPSFPEEVLIEWREEKEEQFGKNWSVVEMALSVLKCYGVYLLDVNPRNITFAESP